MSNQNPNQLHRKAVYDLIDGERDYQDSLPITRTKGQAKNVGDYITLLRVYLREAEERWARNAGDEAGLDSIRKVAGLAVRCMEERGAPNRVVPRSA